MAAGYYKIIIIGDPEVGKTALFHKILFKEFISTGRGTLGMDCFEKTFETLGETIQVELHDTPSKERFRTNSQTNMSNLYRNCSAVLLVYDVGDVYTFENLKHWVRECQEYTWGYTGYRLVWAVIGNKSDLSSEVSFEAVDEFLKEINTDLWFEVSAMTGRNVSDMFQKVLDEVHDRKLRNSKVQSNDIRLHSEIVSTYDTGRCNCTV